MARKSRRDYPRNEELHNAVRNAVKENKIPYRLQTKLAKEHGVSRTTVGNVLRREFPNAMVDKVRPNPNRKLSNLEAHILRTFPIPRGETRAIAEKLGVTSAQVEKAIDRLRKNRILPMPGTYSILKARKSILRSLLAAVYKKSGNFPRGSLASIARQTKIPLSHVSGEKSTMVKEGLFPGKEKK